MTICLRPTRMVPLVSALAGACALLALGTGAQGSLITAVGTVESVSGGEFDGWYKYTPTTSRGT